MVTSNFDFAFVDGPSGGANREFSTKIASEHSDMVIVHDGGRTHEKKWQEMYLKEGFEGPMKGGHRCHLWIKKGFVVEEEKEVKCNITPEGKKFIKFVSTARGWGGCARSCTTIMKYLLKEGHRVEFIPFRNSVSSREYKECFRTFLRDVTVTESYDTVSEHCDVLFIYADDYCWEFGTPLMTETFSNINAERKIMMLNYRRSRIGEIEWTRNFDKYMFLNSEQERELLKFLPEAKTKVLPPCTELSPFLSYVPNYQDGIRIVRHSSQRDTKYRGKLDDHSFIDDLETILNSRKDINISLLPKPSFLEEEKYGGRVISHAVTDDVDVVSAFLSHGNLFWYWLPVGYQDMGPRAILEGMTSGLAVVADKWGGAVDRVTPETGWLCETKEEMNEIIKNVTNKELEEKGKAARQRAVENFIPERWIEEIVGEI